MRKANLKNTAIVPGTVQGIRPSSPGKLVTAFPEEIRGNIRNERKWKRIATVSLVIFAVLITGFFILNYFGYVSLPAFIQMVRTGVDSSLLFFILAGFLAQLVDGVVGMGYGLTSTSLLMGMGVSPAAISGSVHTAEIFSSAASGYSHYKFGNVNRRLFRVLVIPGVLGAIAGAALLVWLGERYSGWVKPLLAGYCMFLGARILYQVWKKEKRNRKVKKAGWLAGAGGFLDSFGGGGWGPLVTSTLISKGRSPQYVIGSVSLTEFFVTLASALAFFVMIGITHWQVIAGLIIGGLVAAPIAARLAGKLPVKTMMICVGVMVIIWSLRIVIRMI